MECELFRIPLQTHCFASDLPHEMLATLRSLPEFRYPQVVLLPQSPSTLRLISIMKLIFSLIFGLFLSVSSLPIIRQDNTGTVLADSNGLAFPPALESALEYMEGSNTVTNMDVERFTNPSPDTLGKPVILGKTTVSTTQQIHEISASVLPSKSDTLAVTPTSPFDSDLTPSKSDSPNVTPSSPLDSTGRRIVPVLAIVICIFAGIFIGLVSGFIWVISRGGREPAPTDDIEKAFSTTSISLIIPTVQLPTVQDTPSQEVIPPVANKLENLMPITEAPLPRAPPARRFKRYSSGNVSLRGGEGPRNPTDRHRAPQTRKPSPLRHVYSASSESISESYTECTSPCPSLYPDSMAYLCSDGSPSTIDLPPTPNLDDIAVRRELFDLDDPFACHFPCSTTPINSLPEDVVCIIEPEETEGYDACWIIGEYSEDESCDEDGDSERAYSTYDAFQ
ncbi:hypothetical protein K439DRAFT_674361 [Ramaria rubella]|nr:hypothetical protein K439DRAFT_674361 [Ramaria rubella]